MRDGNAHLRQISRGHLTTGSELLFNPCCQNPELPRMRHSLITYAGMHLVFLGSEFNGHRWCWLGWTSHPERMVTYASTNSCVPVFNAAVCKYTQMHYARKTGHLGFLKNADLCIPSLTSGIIKAATGPNPNNSSF